MTVISSRFDFLGAKGVRVRLGIFGGTFDPIHIGHLVAAEEAREAFDLDAVLFIPTGMPVFKKNSVVASANDRLAMCRLATKANPYFDVSSLEVDRPGVTYFFDTLSIIRQHFPENVDLFLIVGTDALLDLHKWKNTTQIASMVKVAALFRPGSLFVYDECKRLGCLGYSIELLEPSSLDISSHDIRSRISCGQSIRYLVPSSVCAYIDAHKLYKDTCTVHRDHLSVTAPTCVTPSYKRAVSFDGPISSSEELDAAGAVSDENKALGDEFYEDRKRELRFRVSPKRLNHVEGVVETALTLARRFGLDERKARLAALLHDWDKGLDDEAIRIRIRDLSLQDKVDPWLAENMPEVLHGPTAAAALAKEFPAIPSDVLSAIHKHTTADVLMEPLDKLLYIADALEPSRMFGRIDELRAAAERETLDDLFFLTYEYWTQLLFERRHALHPDTAFIWNVHLSRWRTLHPKKKKTPRVSML